MKSVQANASDCVGWERGRIREGASKAAVASFWGNW